MARFWHLGEIATRPGTYFRTSSGDVTTVGAINGIVSVIFRSNWGKTNEVINISPEEMNNLSDIVGTGRGYQVIKEAFLGGATMVRAVRIGEAGKYVTDKTTGKKTWKGGRTARVNIKTVTETVTTTTPATTPGGTPTTTTTKVKYIALRIYARYYGERKFTVTIRKNPLMNGTKQIIFYDEGNRVIESLSFKAGGNESQRLVNLLKNESKYFTATLMKNKKKISYVTQAKFFGGQDPIVTVAQYSAATEAFERYYWNVIIADTDAYQVQNILKAFIKQSYENGHLGMAVIAGLKKQALADRMAYAATTNDWRVVYLLNGWRSNTGKIYNGYLGAARIGGMIAACETNASLTHIVVQDAVELLEPLTNGQMIQAEEKGCMVLSLNDEDQIWIDNSINTLVTLGNDQDEGWKKIRRTKCRFELMTRINRTCDKLVGRLNNDANGRATLVTAMNSVIREMIGERKLFEGSYAAEDTRYKPVGDRAYFVLNIGDIDSLEKIYLDFNFSFANPFSELDSAATA